MSVLDSIVKAYDIRGTVPDQLDADVAHALGVGFATFVRSDQVVIGRDMRPSGPELVDAFTRGVTEQGVDVIDIGLASTDLMYYAAGVLDVPGAMFTASHNPAGYNGVKLCLAGARPIGVDTGLVEVQAVAQQVLDGHGPREAATCGTRSERDLLSDFADHVVSFIDPADIGSMKVVADTANGMGGLVVPAVFERLGSVELEVMFAELDGTFPNHPADPLQPANQRDLRARVVTGGFDLGLAFDGDADRVFVVDETGNGLSGSTTTAILAAAMLRQHPGATILHNLICSKTVPEVVRELGGTPVRTKVGHSFIKQIMAETGAVFGGEHSAHYYFAAQLQRRQRSHRIADGDGRGRSFRPGIVGGAQAVRALCGQRRDQHRGRRRVGGDRTHQRPVRRLRPGPPRRAHRRLRVMVVQPASLEHRTVAAIEPRSGRSRVV